MKSRKSIQASQYSEFLKANPELDDVLNHEKTVDEICCSNPEFSNYITTSRVRELIRYIIEEPKEPDNSLKSCKFPLVASEFFTSDLPCISDLLFQDLDLLSYLFSFLTTSTSINLLLSGYFLKAFESLLSHNSEGLISFIFNSNLHLSLLAHLNSSSIAEIVTLVLSAQYNSEKKTNLVENLVELIKSKVFIASFNAAMILCKVNKEDDIFQVIIKEQQVLCLLRAILGTDTWVVRNAGTVIKHLLNNAPDAVVCYASGYIGAIAQRMCERSNDTILTQFGQKIRPFGETKLILLEIFTQLVNFPVLFPQIALELSSIISLFPEYIWSSYFHNSFCIFIEALLLSTSQVLISRLISSKFLWKLLEMTKNPSIDCGNYQAPIGCIGHVFKMINIFVNSKTPEIIEEIAKGQDWETFKIRLDEYNEVEARDVGGKYNNNFFENLSSEDSAEKAEENDLIPDYPYTKPITGKELEELTDLFDFEDKKPQKNQFMSTKCINNATLEELGGNEFLTNVFWKMPINHHKLDDIE